MVLGKDNVHKNQASATTLDVVVLHMYLLISALTHIWHICYKRLQLQ